MTPDQLKISILQAAFQGKLVEQREEEGDGEKLYLKCLDVINTAIKHGKIKKSKSLIPITEDDLVFETPSSWKNIKLGEISQLVDGEKLKGKDYKYLEVKYLRGNIEPKIVNEGKFAKKGTLVILVDGENSGEVFTLPEDGYIGSTFKVLYIVETMDVDYVLKFFEMKRSELRSNKKGAAIPHLNKDLLFNYVIPVPPLEEQHRIVAKIEELLPFVDRYAKAYVKLEQFNSKFPEDMKKSILQYAIQGKLVEQRPEEGNAEKLYQKIQDEKQKLVKEGKIKKEKPLAELADDEIPFDIPDSWKWVRLGQCVTILGDGIHGTPNYTPNGEYYFINGNNLSDGNIEIKSDTKTVSFDEYEKYKKELNDHTVFVSINGTIGNVAFYNDEKVILGKSACYFNLVDKEWKEYIFWLIKTDYFLKYAITNATGSTIKNVSLATMKLFPIPLPPIEEQHRIVTKIEELLPYCDQLVK